MTAVTLKRSAEVKREIAWIERYPRLTGWRLRSYLITKRLFDLTLCLAAMPVVLPILLICALAIKIESPNGPVMFRQQRSGINGQRFRIYKFRTMVPNAEEMKKQLMHLNELQWPDFKITNDPRITRVGRILRRTSLDELPQIFNIVLGQMSIVGPRPSWIETSNMQLWHTERLDVKPGLTGLWQIHGRAQTVFDDRLRLDIAYIQHRCMRVDLEIMVRTFAIVLAGDGAH
jgi:lipopolysaccharide/colanic/teichoic acid biosynthesis glycosyltransferase